MRDPGSDAFNALEAHADGSVSVRTCFVPIEVGGYLLPDREDKRRMENRDVYDMSPYECDAELAALDRALAARDALRADGVRDVIVLKERGATSFEEWADERRREIAKRLIYGR